VSNQSHFLPDEIHIEQLEVFTRVGVPEVERSKPQRLTVSISLWPYQQTSDSADHIERTVNYSTVAEETKNFLRDQSVSLIETLAERLANHLLKSFPIQKVTIELRKFVLQDAKYVSVTVTRTACVG
jgi:7,8-dihydroneopterin aldolase/epimerase/oxygenase